MCMGERLLAHYKIARETPHLTALPTLLYHAERSEISLNSFGTASHEETPRFARGDKKGLGVTPLFCRAERSEASPIWS